MFDWIKNGIDGLRDRAEDDTLTPVQKQLRRNLQYRKRVRGGMTPEFLSPRERERMEREERRNRREKKKLDRELLKVLEKRK